MILKKAEVVGHFDGSGTRHAIYSVDFQSNGSRLATCGGDSCVKIWAINSLLDSSDEAQNALLATLTSHSNPVNVVRWSLDGKLLASGSDDNYILIHRFCPGGYGNQPFGSSKVTVKNRENWIRCCTLQGHSMDVLDLDWSACNVLVSGSVDNQVMLWDVGGSLAHGRAIISPTRILSGHKSFVKGVSFDPLGRYLVTCGADNVVIVWDNHSNINNSGNTSSITGKQELLGIWHIVRELTGPMRGVSDKSMFRRLSWTPDGRSVCLSGCMKSGQHVAIVLRRDSWDATANGSGCDLVGHDAVVVCSRFCPYLLSATERLKPVASSPTTVAAALSAADTDPESQDPMAAVVIVQSTADMTIAPNTPNHDIDTSTTTITTSPTRCSSRTRRVEVQQQQPVKSSDDMTSPTKSVDSCVSNSSVDCEADVHDSFGMVALGDQKGVLSLWTPGRSERAVVVLRNMFGRHQSIADIAWMRTHRVEQQQLFLACCSLDGCVVLVDMSVLGEALYKPLGLGVISHTQQQTGQPKQQTVVQSTMAAAVNVNGHTFIMSNNNNNSSSSSNKNRKKRITPTLLQSVGADDKNSTAVITDQQSAVIHIAESTSLSIDGGVSTTTCSISNCNINNTIGKKRLRFTDDEELSQQPQQFTPHITTSSTLQSTSQSFTQNSSNGNNSGYSSQQQQPVIHDLNGMVRRKSSTNGASYYSPTRLLHIQKHKGISSSSGGETQRVGNGNTSHNSHIIRGNIANSTHSHSHSQNNIGHMSSAVTTRQSTPTTAATVAPNSSVMNNKYLSVHVHLHKAICTLKLNGGITSCRVKGGSNSAVSSVEIRVNTSVGSNNDSIADKSVSVSLHDISSSSSAHCRWTTTVAVSSGVVVTALCSCHGSTTNTADNSYSEGVIVMGSSDGILRLLSLHNGKTLHSPMVLGSAISHCDIQQLSTDAEKVNGNQYRILAVTVTGHVQVWLLTVSSVVDEVSAVVRVKSVITASLQPLMLSLHSIDKQQRNVTATGHIAKSVISNSRTKCNGQSVAVTGTSSISHTKDSHANKATTSDVNTTHNRPSKLLVRKCVLNQEGNILVCIAAAADTADSHDNTQQYMYCPDAQTWLLQEVG